MGWLFREGYSRKDLVEKITVSFTSETGKEYKCLAHSSNGGHVLWSVWEVDGAERFIRCDLTKNQRRFGWGNKAMSESMGPHYFGCPLRFLDMVPVADAEWRGKVKEYHAQRNKKPKVGETWTLPNCNVPQVTIVSARPLMGVYFGTRYRIPRKALGKAA